MTLFTINPAPKHEMCFPVHDEDFEVLNVISDGRRRHETWTPMEVRLVQREHGRTLRRSDAPWLDEHVLILRAAAADALGSMLTRNGELLPLSCKNADLVLFNPLHVVDGLDEKTATIERFASGAIMRVRRYAFISSIIDGLDVFKLSNLRASPLFVRDSFVKEWATAGLHGLLFEETKLV